MQKQTRRNDRDHYLNTVLLIAAILLHLHYINCNFTISFCTQRYKARGDRRRGQWNAVTFDQTRT